MLWYKQLCLSFKHSFRPVSVGILAASMFLVAACESKAKRSGHTLTKTEIIAPQTELPEALRAQEQLKDAHSIPIEQNAVTRAVREYDVEKYELEGHFDWSENTLKAMVRIVARPLSENLTSLELDSKVSEIISVTDDSGKSLNYSQDLEKQTLTIELGKVSSDNAAFKTPPAIIAVRIKYTVKAGYKKGLLGVVPQADDPVKSRVAYTCSEPTYGKAWLPGNHHPHDRALFSVAIDMDADESLIANGDLLSEEVLSSGRKRMRYETRYTLPTYIMAFAVGQLEKAESLLPRKSGPLPVSVWKRRGYPINSAKHVSMLEGIITNFETKLIPYPFEKYAVVLLPRYPVGGTENASITFNTEEGWRDEYDFGLNAHELAHQWFGDLVTVSKWDDLWIKEGMATLLAEEARRFKDDLGNYGGLFGTTFNFTKDDAVIDRALSPEKKYTSGPYSRAGWVLTQIRNEVGEEKFWSTLREVLTKYSFGHIGTEEFLNAFAPALGPEKLSVVRSALEAKGQPKISIKETTQEGKKSLELSVEDPNKTLISSLDLEWVNILGETKRQSMKSGVSISIPLDEEGFVVLDPREVHPEWSASFEMDMETYKNQLQTKFVNAQVGLLNAFLNTSPAHQIRALQQYSNWNFTSAEFPAFLDGIDSTAGKMEALKLACSLARKAEKSGQTADVKSWTTALEPFLKAPPIFAFYGVKGLQECPRSVFENALASDFETLKQSPEALDGNLFRYLAGFNLGVEGDFTHWKGAFERATSDVAMDISLYAIGRHLLKDSGYADDATDTEKELIRSFYLEAIKTASNPGVIRRLMKSLIILKDTSSWTRFAETLKKKVLKDSQEKEILCLMNPLADEFPAQWELFQKDTQPWESLSEDAQKILKNRVEGCK
jgi:aminopeptidase N